MFDWLTPQVIIQAGGIVVAILTLLVLYKVFGGYREQGKEFNKILTNHLHDAHLDKIEDVKTREKHTQVLQMLVDKFGK